MDRKFLSHRAPGAVADQAFWLGRAVEARQEERIRDAPVPAPRDSVRRPFGIEALVNHGLSYSTPWRVRDLSLTGAFVEMDATQLPQGAYVEFVLRYRYKFPVSPPKLHTDHEPRYSLAAASRLEQRSRFVFGALLPGCKNGSGYGQLHILASAGGFPLERFVSAESVTGLGMRRRT